jgi:hypothetical protein
MSEVHTFTAHHLKLHDLAQALTNWFEGQTFEVQDLEMPGGDDELVQARRGGWRNFVGLGTALTLHLHYTEPTLTVEVGEGRWADKAATTAVSMFILWPLAITAGVGAYQQIQLPKRVIEFISEFLKSHEAKSH